MKTLLLTGDDPADRYELEGRDIIALKRLVEGYDCIVIDETQRIAAIGLTLKLLHDSQVNLKIIATGSSSIKPALTRLRRSWLGRQIRLTIFYLS
jgi:predicted AAA+ superfamily ATPase